MSERRELTCIGCPMGCQLTVELEHDAVTSVSGNTCKKGMQYAEKECTHPARMLTSTVRVMQGELPVASVKTTADIPKEKIGECMELIRGMRVPAPVFRGDVLYENVLDTGVDLVATRTVKRVLEQPQDNGRGTEI